MRIYRFYVTAFSVDVGNFSSVCWLYGTNLYDKYQVPIGLIQSSYGVTRIESWSAPESLAVCFPDGVVP